MNTKHTFWSLCNKYDKIEVPIIQRDYAQGRETAEIKRLRKKFINDFLINSLLTNQKVELDFVYGSILVERNEDDKRKIFIPLDGQQRLTTLYLLHFFIALKENRLNEVSAVLSKFNYETRPSAHDFCKKLINDFEVINLTNIKFDIENSEWYNENWDNDPTVSGMINMLDTFANNDALVNASDSLLDRLLDSQDQLVSFYFTDLDEFGLTENLYIRMNARGKMLTDFENFKSEFFKIINYNHVLLDQVKDKIEYGWVDNLWNFRNKDSYVIDEPFMFYLNFITEMLYSKNVELKSYDKEIDYLDFKILKDVYSVEANLKFLIFAFDFIKDLKNHTQPDLLWKEHSSLNEILKVIVSKKGDINELFLLFAAIEFKYQGKSDANLYDFLRVVRNLVHNTRDKSRREWSKLLHAINNLIADENVYTLLINKLIPKDLAGFEVKQRNEEIFKAKLFDHYPEIKDSILQMEDDENFKGNISNLLLSNYANSPQEYSQLSLEELDPSTINSKVLTATYSGYMAIAKDNFNQVWGDLLITGIYSQTNESRLMYNYDFRKAPAMINFAKKFSKKNKKLNLQAYLMDVQKEFVKKLEKKQPAFEEITNVKHQLYLYYIMHTRIYNKQYNSFFKNGYNFGWLSKEKGFKSLFVNGIEDCRYFHTTNPIFQTYDSQFRYNLGLNPKNSLEQEMIASGRKREPFKLIIDWANSEVVNEL